MFEDKDEKKSAKDLLRKYLSDYAIETISDKNTLKQLIYLEILNNRLQHILNALHKDSKGVPLQLVDGIHKNIEAIGSLKNKLGLIKTKDPKHSETGFQALEILKKKFAKWREENQGSRTLNCPHCSKMVMLKIRTEAWEAQKHPFFKDRLLTNKHLLSLYKKNKITKEDVANILETSVDYVDWILSKISPDSVPSKKL